METARIIAELVKAFVDLVTEALSEDDPAKLEKVTDVLPAGSPLRTAATAAHEREKTRRALQGGG